MKKLLILMLTCSCVAWFSPPVDAVQEWTAPLDPSREGYGAGGDDDEPSKFVPAERMTDRVVEPKLRARPLDAEKRIGYPKHQTRFGVWVRPFIRSMLERLQ